MSDLKNKDLLQEEQLQTQDVKKIDQKTKDLLMGTQAENDMLPILNKKWKSHLIKSEGKYFEFDFESKSRLVELKSRTCESSTYPTTMVGVNKVSFASKQNKKVYFVFEFTDCIKYIKYDKLVFDTFEIKSFGRNRGFDETKLYYYIPVQNLRNF